MRRRALVKFLVGLLALTGLGFAADRISVTAVEHSMEQALVAGAAQSGGSAAVSGVDLQIHGFPFLTQVASRRLSEISGSMERGSFGHIEVRDLHFTATGVLWSLPTFGDLERRLVGQPQQTSFLHAEHAQANALFPYQTLEGLLAAQAGGTSLTIVIDDYGTGALKLSGYLAGIELGLVAQPYVVPPRTVRIAIEQVLIGGLAVPKDNLPFGLGNNIQDLEFNLDLPAGVALTDIRIEPDGLRAFVTATNVDLNQLVAD